MVARGVDASVAYCIANHIQDNLYNTVTRDLWQHLALGLSGFTA